MDGVTAKTAKAAVSTVIPVVGKILGDATDRGKNGIEILLQIKELSDQGKIEYIPGNHDAFLYNYVKTKAELDETEGRISKRTETVIEIFERDLMHIEENGGEKTLEALEKFDKIVDDEIKKGNIKEKISKEELINWLGIQPIQKKIKLGNIKYALAHAYFDEDLYQKAPYFCMQRGLSLEINKRNNLFVNKYKTILWYREKENKGLYASVEFPHGCVMIVGHTPQKELTVSNFEENPFKPVIYIDTGKGKLTGWDLTEGKYEFKSKKDKDER